MHLDPVPGVVGRHDRHHSGFDRRDVRAEMDGPEFGFGDAGVALVDLPGVAPSVPPVDVVEPGHGAPGRCAIAPEVLGAGEDVEVVRAALETSDGGRSQCRDQGCVASVSLVGSTPPDVLRNGDRGSKRPVNSRGPHLGCSRPADPFDEVRVTDGAETDVVWVHGRSTDIGVPVYRVDAVDERYAEPGVCCSLGEGSDHVEPHRRRVGCRIAVAAAEHRTDVVLGHLGGGDDLVRNLSHLPELLGQRHLAEQSLDRLGSVC